ncbi:unnamed protein product [Rotaria sp. Silwood1]|nr:unnamed protein product [Rotaria sp. Silwood1]
MCLFDYDKHIGSKLAMLTSILFGFCLFHYHVEASRMSNIEQDKKELSIRFKQAITDAMKKLDDLSITCPSGSFFYNGSCYFYLPPKQIDNLKGIAFGDVSVDEAANRCRLLQAELWDIETINEFDYILGRIYEQTQSFDSPRIAVSFTMGKHLLNLQQKMGEQQFISIGNTNDYSLIYKPSPDIPPTNICLIIDISKATRRISLEEKFRLERRMNNRGVQSIIGVIFICLAILILFFHSSYHFLCRLENKEKNLIKQKQNLMSTINSHHYNREKFYSIPNISSDQLIINDGLKNPAFSNDNNELSTMIINSPHTIVHVHRYSTNSSSTTTRVSSIICHHSFLYYFWRLFICLITLIFATLCCHTIYQFKIQHLNTYEKFHNITKEKTSKICQLFQTNLNLYYKIPINYISLSILFILIFSQIFFENFSSRKKRTFKSFWQNLSIPMIFNSHSHIYRFQSAAVFGIIALEILHIFDEYIMNGAKHFHHGPLIDLIIQFGIGLTLGLRYFPILSIFEKENTYENRLENIISYGLGTIYLYCEIIFKIQSDINCALDNRKISIIKDTLGKLHQMGINIQQYMFINLGTNRTEKLNETYINTRFWYKNKIEKYTENLTYDDKYDVENELIRLNYSLELNKQSILYNILRNAPYYYFIVYLTVCLTILFINIFRGKLKKSSSLQTLPHWKYVKYNLLKSLKIFNSYQQYQYSKLFYCLNFLINFFKKYIYSIRLHFRYSKLIIFQNHCSAKEQVCGKGGECMNVGSTYQCRCNFLYHGQKCEKFSSEAIQSIIALIIIILMGLIICILKFNICSQCKSKKKNHSIDDLYNEQQMILERHKNKKSMIN